MVGDEIMTVVIAVESMAMMMLKIPLSGVERERPIWSQKPCFRW
jgi:hypothetical protein